MGFIQSFLNAWLLVLPGMLVMVQKQQQGLRWKLCVKEQSRKSGVGFACHSCVRW